MHGFTLLLHVVARVSQLIDMFFFFFFRTLIYIIKAPDVPACFESPLLHMNPSSSAHLLSTSKHTFVNIMFYYSKCNCNRHVSKINTAKPLQNLARHSSLSKKWLLRRIVNSFFFFLLFYPTVLQHLQQITNQLK